MMTSWVPPPLPARWLGQPRPSFVGRRHELDVIEAAWAAVGNGARQVIFVGAESGAGKSRLAVEVALGLHRLGAAVLIGGCVAELGPPYQPFEDPVDQLRIAVLAGALPVEDLQERPREVIAERLGTLVGRHRAEVPQPAPIDERREIYTALVSVLRAACAQQPLVLLLEDVHWAGSTSLQLLTHVIERTAESRLLILVTHRTTAPDRSGQLLGTIASLYRLDGVRRLDLAPLATEDIAEYLVREGRVSPAQAGPAAVLLRDQTGGNPFLLREVWLDLNRRGGVRALRTAAVPTAPPVVQDMLQQRTAGLTEAVRQALGVCAVLGEDVDAAALLALVGRDEGLVALDALVGTGLLEAVSGADDSYRFVHALVRQAVLDRLPSLQRARHHEQVATVLEEQAGRVEQLAHHFAAAHLLGHTEKAVHYLVEAARVAERGLAYAEAGRLLERAAGLCREQFQREEYQMRAARMFYLACEFTRSQALFRQIATQGDDRLRLRAATSYEETAWFIEGSGQRALDLLTAAIRNVVPDSTDPDQILAAAGIARATALTGAHERAETLISEAIDQARATGDPELLGGALSASLQVGFRPSANRVKYPRAMELSRLIGRYGRWIHLGPAAYHRAVIAYQDGDLAALAEARRDLDLTCEFAGQKYWWTYMGGCIDFGLLLARGRLAEADRFCQSLLELGETFDAGNADGPYGIQSFMLHRESGAIEKVRPLISGEEAGTDYWAPALLAMYTQLKMPAPTARLLRHVLRADLDPTSARWPGVIAFAAEAALQLGDPALAVPVRPLLNEYAGLNLVMGPFVAVFGAADRYIAGLDSLLGVGTPDDTFAAALALDVRTGARLHQAHTLAAWAVHARRHGDVEHAGALERDAREIAEPAGMVRALALIDPPNGGSSRPRPDGLTEREVEVLHLLGEGLSNRDIARRLTISENTAANHVRAVLMKTGSSNRTQAALLANLPDQN